MTVAENARFALVIAESRAAYGPDKREQMGTFLASLRNEAQPSINTTTIHDNVWLIDLTSDLRFLGDVIKWARGSEIHLRILFLQSAPVWIEYPTPEKTKEEA